MRYLKAEVYRFFHSKIAIWTLPLIILYTIFGNYVYKVNDLLASDLYLHLGQEYLLIFLALSFSMSIYLFNDDLKNKLYYEYNRYQMLIARFILWFIYLLFIIIATFISSYIISMIFGLKVALSVAMILNVIKILPVLLIYNLLLLLGLFTSFKSSFSITLVFFLYTFFNYIEMALPSLNESLLRYLFIFNLDFNNLYIVWYIAIIMIVVILFILVGIINYLLKKMA